MNVITLPQKEYRTIVRRQMKIEKELTLLREVVREEIEEKNIRSSTLRKWERISRGLDQGKGRAFRSLGEVRTWFRNL